MSRPWTLLLLSGCMDRAMEPAPAEQKEEARDEAPGGWGGEGAGGAPAASAPMPAQAEKTGAARGMLQALGSEGDGGVFDARKDAPMDPAAPPPPPEAPAAPVRAWFPESFLWQPLVEVPASGTVTVPVTVPDTLTTWRILALGQTRAGAQGGALTTFASTLPAYIDLTVPTFLYAGDTARLAVQAVNQQAEALSAALEVVVEGGIGGGGGAMTVPAYGTRASTITVATPHAGDLHLHATLGSYDSVARTVPVRPTGRPVDQVRGGTLAGPRTLAMSATPGGTDGSFLVTVFPGALGVARAEIDAVGLRGDSLADATYAYALAGMAAPLTAEGTLAPDAVRAVSLRAWQRIARGTRAPGVPDAIAVLGGIRVAPTDSLAGKLAVRLADTLQANQAADGLWTGTAGGTLDASLVQTANAVWVLGPANKANRLRATGAFERFRERLTSPYVAAWALAADVVEPGTAEKLRTTLRDALHKTPDGALTLRVDAARPDGARVSEAEATALAILALPADDVARPDLAAGLLGLYRPGAGFGDGSTNLLALRALEAVFGGDIPHEVAIRVEIDGVEAGRAVLDPTQPHAPVHVATPALAGVAEHTVVVRSEPPVPGLAFTAVARAWVPWEPTAPAGLDLSVVHPTVITAGVPAAVTVSVAGPAGRPFDVSLGLPAGVDPDGAALDALVSAGRMDSWKGEDGRVTLAGIHTNGGAWSAVVPVTPTLAGTLLADAARVWPSDEPDQAFVRVPERWVIR